MSPDVAIQHYADAVTHGHRTPPKLEAAAPADGTHRVSHNVRPTFDFSESLDVKRVDGTTVAVAWSGPSPSSGSSSPFP